MTKAAVKRIGVVTGGGDCPGLNPVIRAVTKTAIREYGMEVIGIEDGFNGILEEGEPRVMPLDQSSVRGILPRGGTILGTTNRGHPFKYPIRNEDGTWGEEDRFWLFQKRLDELGIEAIVMIGGDGTMVIAQDLRERGINVVGVPKTIDNDLSATEVTFGFATALEVATSALDRLHTTAESHHRVMVLEVMGREAGWIALHGGLAGGGDVILIPEIPFRFEPLIAKFNARARRGRPFSLVVVAEGAAPLGGEQVFAAEDAMTGWKRLGGVAYSIGREIEQRGGFEVRVTVLGHIQRGGTPVPVDRILATRFGVEAARLAAQGEFGTMVALRCDHIVAVPLGDAIGRLKLVEPDNQVVQCARATGVVFGDEDPKDVERLEG